MIALKLWRLSIWCHRHGWTLAARFFKTLNFLAFGAILEPEAELQGHVNLSHRGLGVVVHGSTVVGDWVQIWQYATIATNDDKQTPGIGVRLGRGVVVGAHAIIMCPTGRTLTIGEESVIGAGAIVVDDVPPWSIVLPEPSRVVGRRTPEGQLERAEPERGGAERPGTDSASDSAAQNAS